MIFYDAVVVSQGQLWSPGQIPDGTAHTNTVLLNMHIISCPYCFLHCSSTKLCSRGFISKSYDPSDIQFINQFAKYGECLDLLWIRGDV